MEIAVALLAELVLERAQDVVLFGEEGQALPGEQGVGVGGVLDENDGRLGVSMPSTATVGQRQVLARTLRELLSKPGKFFAGWRPVGVARVAVEHQGTGLQGLFEFFLTKYNCLVVGVRTNNFKVQSVAHEPS